jgi:hypothetical protein
LNFGVVRERKTRGCTLVIHRRTRDYLRDKVCFGVRVCDSIFAKAVREIVLETSVLFRRSGVRAQGVAEEQVAIPPLCVRPFDEADKSEPPRTRT